MQIIVLTFIYMAHMAIYIAKIKEIENISQPFRRPFSENEDLSKCFSKTKEKESNLQ